MAPEPVPRSAQRAGGVAFNTHIVAVPERLAVIQVKGHHRHIHTHRGHGGVAKARSLEGLNPGFLKPCLLYTSPSPRDATLSRMPSSA